MKTIYIVRHAKSSWADANVSDVNRPLMEKCIKRTLKIINFLLERNVYPDAIISSHAKRAFDTAKLIAEGLNFPKQNITINKNIYETDEENILNEVFALDNTLNKVMLVGHNPGMTQFANFFLNEKIDYMPTSAVAGISFYTDKWQTVVNSTKITDFIVFPKQLM